MKAVRVVLVFAILLGISAQAYAEESADKAACPVTGKIAENGEMKCPFVGDAELVNNANCPVMGNPVDGKTYTVVDGKVYGFCCPSCIDKFKAEPAKYISTMSSDKLEDK